MRLQLSDTQALPAAFACHQAPQASRGVGGADHVAFHPAKTNRVRVWGDGVVRTVLQICAA